MIYTIEKILTINSPTGWRYANQEYLGNSEDYKFYNLGHGEYGMSSSNETYIPQRCVYNTVKIH